jgi:pseudomonalisin/xanthomonalisin
MTGLCGAAAHAGTGWVPTKTQGYPLGSARLAAQDAGATIAGQSVHVVVSLKLRNKAQLDALTRSMQLDVGKRPLSDAEFMSRYAPTAAQVQAVVTHLRNSGFRNINVAANRMLVSADGSAASVKIAFRTALHNYNITGRIAYANVSTAQVPSHLGDIVLAVQGLQTVHRFHTTLVRPGSGRMDPSTSHAPTDFPTIYNADSLPSASKTTVGIIAEGDLSQTLQDLRAFTSSARYSKVATKVINAGDASSDTDGTVEWNLDSQDIVAAAGGALRQLNFYVATSMDNGDITAAYNSAVSDGSAKVVNVSLGECENDAQSDGTIASNDQIFQSAVAKGQTFSVSTGDSGSAECGDGATGQSYPAVSPYVIAVGGTTLTTKGKVYQSETTWSETGGGPSVTESAPDWQVGAGVLTINPGQRGVPDVAFDADPDTGANVLVEGSVQTVGGTSLSAPLFTGFWARIQSANGNRLNSPGASMYKYFKANPSLYNNIADDSSNGDYQATPGWNYTTGWGSLKVSNLNAFIKKTPGF